MSASDWLSGGGVLGGIVILAQFLLKAVQDYRSGDTRKAQAEAAKAQVDYTAAEASLPDVVESLRLGNVNQAVSIQQQMMNGMREHMAFQDAQIALRDQRIQELEDDKAEQRRRIKELEDRLGAAEEHLEEARKIIGDLRQKNEDDDAARAQG